MTHERAARRARAGRSGQSVDRARDWACGIAAYVSSAIFPFSGVVWRGSSPTNALFWAFFTAIGCEVVTRPYVSSHTTYERLWKC